VRKLGALVALVCLFLGQAAALLHGSHVFWHDHEQPHSHASVADHPLSDSDEGGLHGHFIAGDKVHVEVCRTTAQGATTALVPLGPQLAYRSRAVSRPLQPPFFQACQRPNAPPGEVPSRAPPLLHG
jgi:hypothetical protein